VTANNAHVDCDFLISNGLVLLESAPSIQLAWKTLPQ